jgi:hypothetical protein
MIVMSTNSYPTQPCGFDDDAVRPTFGDAIHNAEVIKNNQQQFATETLRPIIAPAFGSLSTV